jgi:DNA polymerase-3 subunit gamma/tau
VSSTDASPALGGSPLYQRYRPRRFSEVIGQPHAVSALRNSVLNQSDPTSPVPHTLVLHGPRGCGKTTLARIWAIALNCPEAETNNGEPCGVCQPCRDAARGASYDVIELDAASNNGVDAVRDLIAKLQLATPGRARVVILDEAHMLSAAASNALLKITEDPPKGTKFVFATTEPHKLLPTIRSRAMCLQLSLVPNELLAAHALYVVEDAGLTVPPNGIEEAVRRARGSVRDMLSELGTIILGGSSGPGDPALGLVDAVVAANRLEILRAIHTAIATGTEPRVLCEEAFAHLSSLFVTIMGAPEVASLPDTDGRRADRAKALGPRRCVQAMEALGEALAAMKADFNAQVHLQVHLCRYAAQVEREVAAARQSRPQAA